MSDFVRRALLKRLNRENFVSRLERVESQAGPRPSARVENLGELTLEPGDAKSITQPSVSVQTTFSDIISNSGEQDIWTDILPSGSLRRTSLIEIDLWGLLFNNSGGSRSCTWKIYPDGVNNPTTLITVNTTVNLQSWGYVFKIWIVPVSSGNTNLFHEVKYGLGNRSSGLTLDTLGNPDFNGAQSLTLNVDYNIRITWTSPVTNNNLFWHTYVAKMQVHQGV